MSGKRVAAISFGLILDLAARLDEASVPAECAPSLDEALAMVWPLAKQLAKLERTARDSGRAAATARAALLDAVVAARCPVPAPGNVARKPGAGAGQLPRGDWSRWEAEIDAGREVA